VDPITRAHNDIAIIAQVILYERHAPRRRGATTKAFDAVARGRHFRAKAVQHVMYRRSGGMRLVLDALDDEVLQELAGLFEQPRTK
jgi:hypothetical protein